jgi:hypothetical protein
MSDLVMCFLLRSVHGIPNAASWVYVYRDGRLERRHGIAQGLVGPQFQWLPDRTPGALVGGGVVDPDVVQGALDLAARVLTYPKPQVSAAAHDPTQELAVEIVEQGSWRSAWFTWGRASRNDAPLEPVIGEQAIEDFNALHAVLTRIRSASPERR